MDEKKYWLWLSMIFGAGSRRVWEAMRLFDKAEACFDALVSGSLDEKLDDKEISNIHSTGIDKAEQLIAYCTKNGIGVVCYKDDEYPPQLRHIVNPPAVLYYRGNISCLKGTRTVTSVGARNASDYSLRAASRICRELAKCGVVIVSGFALGIDIASHLAAAEINRPTACVLGCGVDVNYPKGNFAHRDTILNNGGVFISEFPPGAEPHSYHFPMRNRILAALGRVTMVFEASEKSGSLITADMASKQGREVFCLPPADIFSADFSGNIAFLRNGAQMLFSARDVLDCFRIGSGLDKEIRSMTNKGISRFGVDELAPKKKKTFVNIESKPKKRKTEKVKKNENMAELPPEPEYSEEMIRENVIFALEPVKRSIAQLIMRNGALHADDIAQRLEMDAAELMTELTELELSGIVKSLPGKMFEIN